MKVNKQILKTRILTLIIIFTCILHFTCKPDIPEETESYDEYTNVVYSPELNAVTIYLNGRAPVPRALSRPLALMGCDYFEVNFMDSANNLTRAEWMAGKIAGISDLPAGNYGNIAGANSSILFAGKSDRTLMAVGRLTAVDGAPGITAITDSSKTVTFTLDAIVAYVSSDPNDSSFITAAKDTAPASPLDKYMDVSPTNTVVSDESIFYTVPSKTFPCFKLERLQTVRADYTFRLNSSPAGGAFDDYGIFVSPPAYAAPGLPVTDNFVERKAPRYYSDGGIYHESILLLDENTDVKLLNNNPLPTDPPYRFQSTVEFTFDTTNTINGSMFAFTFFVPVYALKEYDKFGNKSRWYVRSSYGPNLYDLDDGTVGMGGGVLIKTGHIQDPLPQEGYKIKVVQKPIKWQYFNTFGADRRFDITGLQVDLTSLDESITYRANIPYDELWFIIGDKSEINAMWTSPSIPAPTGTPYSFSNMFFGIIEVTVKYQASSGLIMETSFYVLVSGMGYDLSRFNKVVHIYSAPPANPVWNADNSLGLPNLTGITGAGNILEQMFSSTPAGTSVLVVLHESFNISMDCNSNPTFNTSNPSPTLFFFVAASPDIVMGRNLRSPASGNTTDYPVQGRNITQNIAAPAGMNGLIAYYFGEWPFRDPPSASYGGTNFTGVPATTYPFKINTRGTYQNFVSNMDASPAGVAPNNYTNKMITDWFLWFEGGADGGIYNVKVGPGATVEPKTQVPGYDPGELITVYPFLH